MTSPRLVTVDIDTINASGDGVATAGGVQIAIPFTIPGERVRARMAPPRRGRAIGTLVEVVRASAHRVAPPCRHFGPAAALDGGACGGCTWQHIAYPEQLRLKAQLVDRLVRAIVPDAPAARPTLSGTAIDSPWGYRNKVHFVFSSQGRRGGASSVHIGHYARGSRRVIPVVECPVHDERGNTFAFAARDIYAATLSTGTSAASSLRSLAVRAGAHTNELMATLVVSHDRDRRVRTATKQLIDIMRPTSMHLNVHARDDGFVFGAHTRRLHGPSRLREQIAGATFLMSPTAFFQTNVRAAEILVRLVLDAIPAPSRALDLYAGSGLFAIPLARAGHDVIAVEENREAVADAEAALGLNPGIRERCRFIARRVEEALASLRRPDVAVLDPPREGCSAGVLRGIVNRLKPSTLIYVSCNPEVLARELGTICSHGYRICSLQPVDMFPHSAHIEAVAVLSAERAV